MNKPIVLLHGALGSSSQLEAVKKILKERGREVYTINFSGHSGKPFSEKGFGIDVFSRDLLSFLDDEKIEASDIFGYSMGGYVAMWLAYQHASRVNNVITLGTKFDWNPESAEKEIKKMDPEKIRAKIPAFARILEHRHAPNDWKELIRKTAEMMFDLGNNPLLTKEIISTINHKCKVLLGDQDDMADRSYSEKIAGWLPNGIFHVLENTTHPIEKIKLEMLVDLID